MNEGDTTIPVVRSTETPVESMSTEHNRRALLFALGLIVVIGAVFAYVYVYKKGMTQSPEEVEQLLRGVSVPVTTTSEEQAAMINALKQTPPTQPELTSTERESALNQLRQ
ncbi:MAG: hypothetical protein KBB91_00685 [Candidatus Pacebacteria bacterium]|nr:hypothetical protein [Candidatus Paceibacterota bacterium]MBP9700922.1 hypothetical protein [Candidatus Paceibacterota bacterium]